MLEHYTYSLRPFPKPGPSARKLRLFACACHALCTCGCSSETWPAQYWAVLVDSTPCPCTRAARAALLREVAGNPFRPMTPPLLRSNHEAALCLSLAQAAYGERLSGKCRACGGRPRGVRVGSGGWTRCPICQGGGTLEDGTLDPARLAVLGDALEEAGCTDEVILHHLRGEEPCVWGDERGKPSRVQGWRTLRSPHVRGCHVVDLLLGKV